MPGGYVIGVDPAAIEPRRFPDLVAQARATGDDQCAIDLFAQALALYRSGAPTPRLLSRRIAVCGPARVRPERHTDGAVRGDPRFLDSFEVPAQKIPTDLAAQVALYRGLADGKQLLIVLDNARDTDQVRALLPRSPELVVVSSRHQLTGLVVRDEAKRIVLDVLSTARAGANPGLPLSGLVA